MGGLIAILAVAVVALAALLGLRHRRISRLAAQIEAFLAKGKPALPYSVREDSFAPLHNAIAELENKLLLTREQLTLETRRVGDMTADISHQLKTPLASLRLFVEMDGSAHMEEELSQIERMEELIAALLRLEKLCADGYAFVFSEQPLRPLIEAVWDGLRPIWPEKRLVIEGDAVLRCDGKWLGEAMQNLLKNACEHTAPQGRISVRLEQSEHMVYCTVEDDGGGVAEKDLPHLFERFYRAEGQSRSGSGLGLAIVREIIYRHHGHIRAANTAGGLRIDFSIPVLNLTKT